MNTTADAVISGLRAMRTTAPATVLPRVLVTTGLADSITTIDGPTGPLFVAWNDRGVTAVAPATSEADFAERHEHRTGRAVVDGGGLPEQLGRGIRRTIETGRLGRLPVDLGGLTDFQQDVLEVTATIPKGEMRSYGWIAKELGRSGAVRAVGSALNRNPIPVLIPCHRVGRTDGSIGEYAYGPEMKRALLGSEGLDVGDLDDRAARGVRLVGSDTTHIFCVPTCRNAKRIADTHTVEFHNEAAADIAGYRPCKVCRPAAAA